MKTLFLAVMLFVCSGYISSAETIFLHCGKDKETRKMADGNYYASGFNEGEYGARLLSDWERANPTKKIICITINGGPGSFTGFWITYKLKKPQVTVQKQK
jgi:hypothetical protein